MPSPYESIRSWGADHADQLLALSPAHARMNAEIEKYVASGGSLPLEPARRAVAALAETALVVLAAPPSGDAVFDAAVRRAATAYRDGANLVANVDRPDELERVC